MTDPELQGLAAQALNMCKRDIERGVFGFLLASYHAGEGLHRMDKIEALITQRLGAGWLDSGHGKDIGFGLIRVCVDLLPPDAIVFCTACNVFKTNKEFDKLPPARRREILDGGADRCHQAVFEGVMDIADALAATAQTPERVCMYSQMRAKPGAPWQTPETHWMPQAEFDGRLKMFGSVYEAKKATRH